jgi:uncharacterized membrane protein
MIARQPRTALSYRHASIVIALIGLIGGFATPLLKSIGTLRPIGLFAYILLLTSSYSSRIAAVGAARCRAWGTPSPGGMDRAQMAAGELLQRWRSSLPSRCSSPPPRARCPHRRRGGDHQVADLSRLRLRCTSRSLTSAGISTRSVLLVVLGRCELACRRSSSCGRCAASGSIAVLAVWALSRNLDAPLAWEAAGSAVLLAAVFHAFVEWRREPSGAGGPAPAAMTASLGMFAVLIAAGGLHEVPLWPWLFGWLALAALLAPRGFSD